MPEPAGTLVSSLLRRIRDPEGGATSRDFARDILSRCQQIANLGAQTVVTEVTLTTEPQRCFYPILSLLPTCAKILGMREGERELSVIPSTELRYLNRAWFRAIADRFEAYSVIGHDLVIVWPAKSVASSVTVSIVTLTATLVNDTTLTALPAEDLLIAMDLAEAALLIRQREYAAAQDLGKRLQARLKVARPNGAR